MTALAVMLPRPRPLSRADHAVLALLRQVRSESWEPQAAARELLDRIGRDRLLLDLLRARVARRLLGRPSQIDLRASATLVAALELLAADALVPSQRQGGLDVR